MHEYGEQGLSKMKMDSGRLPDCILCAPWHADTSAMETGRELTETKRKTTLRPTPPMHVTQYGSLHGDEKASNNSIKERKEAALHALMRQCAINHPC
mmetsp:Transcript_39961/g.94130  ORF Transcript_39961/g.94130 Transcript_39961/m.94130 type:complete len:97 (-) Transcript_39961:135-425(-)